MNFKQGFQQKENECIIDEGQSFSTENLNTVMMKPTPLPLPWLFVQQIKCE